MIQARALNTGKGSQHRDCLRHWRQHRQIAATGLDRNRQQFWQQPNSCSGAGQQASWTGMGLLTIIKKVKRKEKEMRFLMV